ncbi:uncharacterized protein C8R40DRAFT_1064820 [Lentinula edodes]|uniref:uncharacterized protein n=1 Tax=Lentinula edodes TaxID=5353 RepID=UPI001E8E2D7B|nr:uncharacterized protein C8R40DRAFT_1064820 [Lentinula edodes]KAH7881064.1 hypothetical protein C8R40DRAFT_1064820 [Lentinula edodes]
MHYAGLDFSDSVKTYQGLGLDLEQRKLSSPGIELGACFDFLLRRASKKTITATNARPITLPRTAPTIVAAAGLDFWEASIAALVLVDTCPEVVRLGCDIIVEVSTDVPIVMRMMEDKTVEPELDVIDEDVLVLVAVVEGPLVVVGDRLLLVDKDVPEIGLICVEEGKEDT